ncbi:IS3 family transposase, partial [Klebsiella pneumoniae]|uniref:IS3 family transposase n=1 Tax=Klebsiella pneumoniae TaxID=573 RepID=UPI0035CD1F34
WLMMSLWDALRMNMMISYQELVRTFLREQFIEFNELLLFDDLNLFNQRMAEYLVLYNSKRPHKSLELMTPVDYILRESKNCNMWWTHTTPCLAASKRLS